MPDQPWTFNGTGVEAQVEFKIIQSVNGLDRLAGAVLNFDPAWTGVFFYPSGDEKPTLNSAYLKLRWVGLGDINNEKKVDIENVSTALDALVHFRHIQDGIVVQT